MNPIEKETSVFEAKNLSKTYKGRTVVHDVSLRIEKGHVVGLLGPNGAGKTTCFYMMIGLVPQSLGSVYLDGEEISHLPLYRRAQKGVGYLPQEASIFRGLTVEQNILAVLEIIEPNEQKQHERLDALLKEFSIDHLRKSASVSLSGGERRRLEIARALATDPRFLLLDEPFAGVDPISIQDIRGLITHLKKRGIGILITDHNVRETLEVIDYVYIIHGGRVLKSGTVEEITSDKEVKRLYLGENFSL
jgi:lipopolysaccharide export system ATP-binding protein